MLSPLSSLDEGGDDEDDEDDSRRGRHRFSLSFQTKEIFLQAFMLAVKMEDVQFQQNVFIKKLFMKEEFGFHLFSLKNSIDLEWKHLIDVVQVLVQNEDEDIQELGAKFMKKVVFVESFCTMKVTSKWRLADKHGKGLVCAKPRHEVYISTHAYQSSRLEHEDGSLKFPMGAQTFCVIFSTSKVKMDDGGTPIEASAVPQIMALTLSISSTSLRKESQLKIYENLSQRSGDDEDVFELFKHSFDETFAKELQGVEDEGKSKYPNVRLTAFLKRAVSKGASVIKFELAHECLNVNGHGEKAETSHSEDEAKEGDFVQGQPSNNVAISHEDNDVLVLEGVQPACKTEGHCGPHACNGLQSFGPMVNTRRTCSLSAQGSIHVPQAFGCRVDSPKSTHDQRISSFWEAPTEKPMHRLQKLTCEPLLHTRFPKIVMYFSEGLGLQNAFSPPKGSCDLDEFPRTGLSMAAFFRPTVQGFLSMGPSKTYGFCCWQCSTNQCCCAKVNMTQTCSKAPVFYKGFQKTYGPFNGHHPRALSS